MLKKLLVSEGRECFPQPLLVRQIGKWGRKITAVNCLNKDSCSGKRNSIKKFAWVMLHLAACFLEAVQGRYLIAQLGSSGAQKWPGSLSLGSIRTLGILCKLFHGLGQLIPSTYVFFKRLAAIKKVINFF